VVQEPDSEVLDLLVVRFEKGKDHKGFGRRAETREPEASTTRVPAMVVPRTLILVQVDLEIQAQG
jgi:hypothetical protein